MGGFLCLRAEIHLTLRSTHFAEVRVRAWVLTFCLRQTQLPFPSMLVREAVIKSRDLFNVATLKEGQKRGPVTSSPGSSLVSYVNLRFKQKVRGLHSSVVPGEKSLAHRGSMTSQGFPSLWKVHRS